MCPESIEWNIHYAEKRQKNGLSQINMFSSYEFRKLVDIWRELMGNLGEDI
jgi:hypothetical protein